MESIKNYFKTFGKGFFSSLFERSIRVYIQKHLGEFLLDKLTTDQVELGLEGGSLTNFYLNAETINERLECFHVPFTLVEGYVDTLRLKIPWSELSAESIMVEVNGLMLVLKFNREVEVDDGMDVKSMFESMTASMVEEVMKTDVAKADIEKISEAGKGTSPFESIELMSDFISSITSRIQVKLENVVIRTEKSPGVSVEFKVDRLEYYDKDCATSKRQMPNFAPTPQGFSTKVLEISKVSLNVEEVWSRENSPKPMDPAQQSSMAFDIAMSSPPTSGNFMQTSSMTQSVYPGMTVGDSEGTEDSDEPETGGQIPFVVMDKKQTLTIQIKNDDQLPGPNVNVTWTAESLHVFMSPKILALVTQLLNSENGKGRKNGSKQEPMTTADFELCRQMAQDDERVRRDSGLDNINVPPLSLDRHVEMMHGATADSLLSEDDMFYSTHPNVYKSSAFDASDSASVSTFAGSSTFSTANASAFSHSKKWKDRSSSRSWDDHTEETQNVNLTIPFFTVTVLLEDPEPCTVIPGPSARASTPETVHQPSSSFPPKAQSLPTQAFGPSSLPKSFTGVQTQHSLPNQHVTPSSSSAQSTAISNDNDESDSDDEEEFHDSGDFFEKSVNTSSVDGLSGERPRSETVPTATQSCPNMSTDNTATPTRLRASETPPSGATDSTTNRLQDVASNFFEAIAKLESRTPLHKLRDKVATILPLDHLGLLAKPIHLDIVQEKKAAESKYKVKATFGKLEVIECLFDCLNNTSDFAKTALPKLPQYSVKPCNRHQRRPVEITQLLSFDVNGLSDSPTKFDPKDIFSNEAPKVSKAALTLTLESVQQKRRRRGVPSVKLSLEFGKLTSELDITMIDRVTNLINPDSSASSEINLGTQLVDDYGHIDEAIKDDQGGQKLNLDVKMNAVHATLRVRFPIPDLRANQPSQTRDWWRRNLHKEVLLLEMERPEAMSNFKADEQCQLELQFLKISAYLQEDINKDPILFGEVTVEDEKATPFDAHHFNWPRILIKMSNKPTSVLETEDESDTSATSVENYIEPGFLKKDCGPFSKKKNLYERDDLSHKEQNAAPANDEMVMPGNAAELKQFRDEALIHTCLSIDITIPSVTAFLHSKDFLELLYNRFNNDLLMWEPQPPRTHMYMSSMAPSSTSIGIIHMLQYQHGDMIKSAIDDPSESDDEESMHYSIHDHSNSKKINKPVSKKLPNKTCFSLSIGNGRLLAVIPHVDQDSNPDVHGEVMLTLKDALLFSVNQHNGDPDLKYLCFQANKAHMYHNSHVLTRVQPGNLDHIKNSVPTYLTSKIYRSDRWVSDKSQGRAGWGPDSPDMLALVVKIKMDTINNVKNFIVALRVDGGTLRHEMHRSGESWISQLIDLLDLKDFPIIGYTWPKVVTEIHLQIEHCCVDYRPINLPIWSFVTVEHFSVCTNIVAESAFSKVKLLLEDSALFLSKKCNKEVNLLKDYVCVAEMDQFKIWLQFCYDKTGKQKSPKSDLRFMVNELNLRTCADSTRALLDLIQYIASDGDLMEKFDDDDDGDLTPVATDVGLPYAADDDPADRQIPSPVFPVPAITPEQEASVASALEEAMADVHEFEHKPSSKTTKQGKGKGTKVFFSYDSASVEMPGQRSHLQVLDPITVSADSSDSSSPDEEVEGYKKTEEFELVDYYCRDVTHMKGTHEVIMLTEGPIEVVENFLNKPTSSYDHLKAPDKFPDPEYQYTLREMSVVWHIYGGSDFSQPRRTSSSDRIGLPKGLQSPHNQRRLSDGGKSRHGWRHRGGNWRDFDVLMQFDLNKLRFRYEVYPTYTVQASRFKLMVNNFELRDKVVESDVNKFLVKLVDKEHPEQTSAYMLMFSGVFTRPDYLPFRKECEVKAFCMPIKLNIDQVSLNFLRKFLSQLSDADPGHSSSGGAVGGRSSPLGGRASPSGSQSSPRPSVSSSDPIMRISEPSTKESSMDETELLMKFDELSNQQSIYFQARLNENELLEGPEEDLPVFIKSFVLISDITIKLDYRGKRCDMDTGVMGVMLGVASLTGSMVKLKKINCQKGMLGWDKLLMYTANEWLTDIKQNQIHSILKGVGSLSIFCQIFQGVTDLIRLPIEQYQKDRRIIRGLQRGANSFTLNTVMAILELTNKVVGSIQYCAELGYDMMSPGPSVRRRKQKRIRKRQPRTTAEGAKAALHLMTEGVKETAASLSAMVSEEGAQKGYVGVVGGTLRNATPECFLKPLALLAEAGTSIVQGARNEVDPSVMKEEEDRWKQA